MTGSKPVRVKIGYRREVNRQSPFSPQEIWIVRKTGTDSEKGKIGTDSILSRVVPRSDTSRPGYWLVKKREKKRESSRKPSQTPKEREE